MHSTATMIITAAALLLSLGFWFALWRRHRLQPLSFHTLLSLVLVVGLLCRIAFALFTPTFYAPDEQAHFNYVKFLSEHRAFPVQTTQLGDPANEWEYFQPPLYYLALVPFYHAAQSVFHSPAHLVLVLRTVSIALWLLNFWLGCRLLRELQVRDEFLHVSTLSLVCLLPTYTFVSSAINNDNLLATLGSGALCVLARKEQTVQTSLLLGVVLGLALLTKQSAIILLPGVITLAVLEGFVRKTRWPEVSLRLAIALITALAMFSPWALRNLHTYGTLAPENLSAMPKLWPSVVHGVASAAHNLAKTFWAVSGVRNDVGYPFPLPGMLLSLLALVGLVLGLKRKGSARDLRGDFSWPGFIAFVVMLVVAVLLVLRFGYDYGMGQGRHLFPLLHGIGLLLALGFRELPLKNAAVHVVGAWIVYAVTFLVFSLSCFP